MSYNPAMFGVHRHSASRDVMVFLCHTTLQDQEAKGCTNFHSASRDVMVFLCHTTLQDQEAKGCTNFLLEAPQS